MGKKKGKLEEVISYAKFADNISKYKVAYLDRKKGKLIEIPLKEFLENEELPDHLVRIIKKGEKIVYRKE